MSEWLDAITTLVNRVAKEVKLSDVHAMFDGDGWIWTWRSLGERVAEAKVRVRPDAFGDGLEIEISAATWMPERRHISAGRVYYAQYVDWKTWPDEEQTLSIQLQIHLARAWHGAQAMALRLPEIEKTRDDLISQLRERKLLK